MVGKNNQRIKNEVQQHQVFALRKLSVGVASVLLGTTCMFINNVHADVVPNENDSTDNSKTSDTFNAPYMTNNTVSTQTVVSSTANSTTEKAVQTTSESALGQIEASAQAAVSNSQQQVQQAAPANTLPTSDLQPAIVNSNANSSSTSNNLVSSNNSETVSSVVVPEGSAAISSDTPISGSADLIDDNNNLVNSTTVTPNSTETLNNVPTSGTLSVNSDDYQTLQTERLETRLKQSGIAPRALSLAALYGTALYANNYNFVPITPGGSHSAASWHVQSSYTDARGNVWKFDLNNNPSAANNIDEHGFKYQVVLTDVQLSQETRNSKSISIPGGYYGDFATSGYIDAVLKAGDGYFNLGLYDPVQNPAIMSYTIDPELVHKLAQQMETIKFGSLNVSYNGDWTGVFSADNDRKSVGLGNMHSDNTVLKHVDMRLLDMSDATSFKGLFNKCVNLEDVNFEGNSWKTSKLTNTAMMFDGCSALKVLDFRTNQSNGNDTVFYSGSYPDNPISSSDICLDTKNVTDMHDMFLNASHLVAILGIGAFDTSNVSDFHEMFSGCSSLMFSDFHFESFNLSAWDTSKAKNMDWMFRNAGISQLAINGWHIPTKHAFIFNGMGGYQLTRTSHIDTSNIQNSYPDSYLFPADSFYSVSSGKYHIMISYRSKNSSRPMSLGAIVYGHNLNIAGSLTSDDISINKDTDQKLSLGRLAYSEIDGYELTQPPLIFMLSDQNLVNQINQLAPRNYALVETYRGYFTEKGHHAGSFFMPIDTAYYYASANDEDMQRITDFKPGGKYNQRLINETAKVLDLSKWKIDFDISLSQGSFDNHLVQDDDGGIIASERYKEATPVVLVSSSAISQPRTMKVTFVDGSNNVISTQEINGKTNEDTVGTIEFPPGYALIPNTNMDINGVDNPNLYPTQGNNGGVLYYNFHFRDDNTSPTLVVHVEAKTLTINPDSGYKNGQPMPDNPSRHFTGIGYDDLNKNVVLSVTYVLPNGQKYNSWHKVVTSRAAFVNETNGNVTYGEWRNVSYNFGKTFNFVIPGANGNDYTHAIFSPLNQDIVLTSTKGQNASTTVNVPGRQVTNTINVYDADNGNKLIKTISVSGIASVDRPIIDIASQLGRPTNSFFIDNNTVYQPAYTGGYADEVSVTEPLVPVVGNDHNSYLFETSYPKDSIGARNLFRIKHMTNMQYQIDLVPNVGPESIYIHHAHENVSRHVQASWTLRYDNINQIPADKRNKITAQVLGPNDTLEGAPQSLMLSPTQTGVAGINYGSHDLFNNTYSWENKIDFSNTTIKPFKIHSGYGYAVWSSYNTATTVNGKQVGYQLVDDYIPADELMIFDQIGNHLGDYGGSLLNDNSTSPLMINFVSHLSYHTYQLRTNVVYRYNGNDLFTDTLIGKVGDQLKVKYAAPRGFVIKAGQNLPNVIDPAVTKQIVVDLDQDKAINYRFTDLTDLNNQKMVPAGSPTSQGPDWAHISGKEDVSQYIPGFDFINGIGTDGASNYKSYQQYLNQLKGMGYDVDHDDTQSFVIDGVMYSPTDAKTMIDNAYDKKFNNALQKALVRWKADRQRIVDETSGYEKQKQEATQHIMTLADQLRTVDPSSQQHATLFKQITNEHNKISALDNKIDAAWRRLSNIHFNAYLNSDMASMIVIQGFNHKIDSYSYADKPNTDTKLSSGKTISSVANDSSIYNPDSYGDYTSFKLNLNVIRNANGDTWPPEIDHGPVTGFIGPYDTVYTDMHFDDPNFEEIRTGKRDNYQYDLLTGKGYVYSIDNVTGNVTKVLVDGEATNLPIFYLNQAVGYDLYINGRKINHSIDHPSISWNDYVKGPHDWTIEYRPLAARVNWKIVNQNGNELSSGGENVYADGNSSINGQKIINDFVHNYNKSNSDKYAEFISSDIPNGTSVSGQDAADHKTFDYTVRVNIYDRTQVHTTGDTHVRTIYFVNRADPNNSARAITDTVDFDTIKDVFIKDGQQFDIPTQAGGTTTYKAKSSFDDATVKIKAAIGTDNYTVVSGSQYIGAYTPDTPGGDDITIEYN